MPEKNAMNSEPCHSLLINVYNRAHYSNPRSLKKVGVHKDIDHIYEDIDDGNNVNDENE